tara:strand:+ start:21079 stop:22746 length:1668 start_codon:yes stop_codon:yes gene_type:complete
MTNLLQLTEQRSPAGQTFIVDEASVITGIGVYFAAADGTYPITLEMRPTAESGSPSAKRFIPGSRVTASAAAVTAKANTTFGAATEYKFTFPEPQYIPANSLVSFVIYTSAPVGSYKMFIAENGEFNIGTTTSRYSAPNNTVDGSFFSSSNGTNWEGDNNKDIAFKIYRAKFTTGIVNRAKMYVNNPPMKALTENDIENNYTDYTYDPLVFKAGADSIGVIHPSHGFQPGDKVKLTSTTVDSSDTINGVLGSSILGTRTITSTDPFGYNISIDSAADSSVRAGGTGMYASEQYSFNEMILDIPTTTPSGTIITPKGNFTSSKSFGGSETAYVAKNGISLSLGEYQVLPDPHVITSTDQETLRLSGAGSTIVQLNLETENQYVAPYFNVNESNIVTMSNFIDYQQSDDSALSGRNKITTLNYTSESNARGGTTASKHITIPYRLVTSATSIVVLVDALRPVGADFSVWYRSFNSADEASSIENQGWFEFDKSVKNTSIQGNVYSETAQDDTRFVEYEFAKFDMVAFDTYQIKITMNSNRSSYPPIFKTLRTIATSD